MLNKNYINNIPEPQSNILHDSSEKNITSLSYDNFFYGQFNNLVLNSNLDNSNIIK